MGPWVGMALLSPLMELKHFMQRRVQLQWQLTLPLQPYRYRQLHFLPIGIEDPEEQKNIGYNPILIMSRLVEPQSRACRGSGFIDSYIYNRVEESGKLLVSGHRAPWIKRGARRLGELEWRQREVREKERGAHNKEGQSVSGERPRSGKSHSQAGELAKRLLWL